MASDEDELKPWSLPPDLERDLKLALAGRLETSLELEKALAGEPGAVKTIWESIVNGTANLADRDTWLEAVAKRVVRDVIPVEACDRSSAALKAIGFTTFFDKHWDARKDLEALDGFENPAAGQVLGRRKVAQLMIGWGHFGGPPPRNASKGEIKTVEDLAMKTIDRLRLKNARTPEE